MNKWLLGWNIVVSIMAVLLLVGGCSSGDSAQIANLNNQVAANKAEIAALSAKVAQQDQVIAAQGAQMAQTLQVSLQTFSASLQQYVQQYVQTQLGK